MNEKVYKLQHAAMIQHNENQFRSYEDTNTAPKFILYLISLTLRSYLSAASRMAGISLSGGNPSSSFCPEGYHDTATTPETVICEERES